jgi:phosphatidate cytidylyltransferase
MALRVLSAGVGIPVAIWLSWLGGVPYAVAIFALAVLGLIEMLRAYWSKGIQANIPIATFGLFLPFGIVQYRLALYDYRWGESHVGNWLAIGALVFAPIWELVRAARTGEMKIGRNVARGLLCAAYVSLFVGLANLRQPEGWPESPVRWVRMNVENGLGLVLLTLFSVWAVDTFAYLIGKTMGRHKLAPAISPGKTVEGAVGGLVAGLAVGALFGHLIFARPMTGLLVGAIAGTLGQIGDLFESALKREIGIKDFGSIMPGHGGVLDRFDSLLFVAPAVWLLWAGVG